MDPSPLEVNAINDQIAVAESDTTETSLGIHYFAFVPLKTQSTSASNSTSPFPGFNVSAILGDRLSVPANATNQLWIASTEYSNGSNCENPLNISFKYTKCILLNMSYVANFTFENGIQNITITNYTKGNVVEYPVEDATVPSDLVQYAYSAHMWALTDQLIGFMKLYKENSSDSGSDSVYGQIQTPIQDSALLGSSDLDVFFDQRHLLTENRSDCEISDQRGEDIELARNDTLRDLIPELSFNITMSYFSSSLLSYVITCPYHSPVRN
jgi:hypothetical protein